MSAPKRVLVTGSTGFVGRAMIDRLIADGVMVTAAVRRPDAHFPAEVRQVVVGNIGPMSDWSEALASCDVVLHLAARVHQMNDADTDPLSAFRHVNSSGTQALATQAAAAGIRRLVFVSSVKVNGEETRRGQQFTELDAPAPADAYGVSKMEAECSLRQLAAASSLEVTIVRPPLVYGPGVRANFHSMVRWVARGVPLPFGRVTQNRRSLVALANLVSLLRVTLSHPAAANETFLVSDGEDVSTADLLRRTACALGLRARLVPVPMSILAAGASAFGKGAVLTRLCGSLQVDSSKARRLLHWTPAVSLDDGLHHALAPMRGTR